MRGQRALPLRPDLQSATSSSYDVDGFLVIGVDGDAAVSNLPPSEALQPLGLIARPLDPDTDGSGNVVKACTVLRLTGDNTDDLIVLGDPRVTPKVLQVPVGGLVLHEPSLGVNGDLAYLAMNDDGSHSIRLHVPSGTPPSKITLEVAGGGPKAVLDGTTLPPKLTLQAGGPSIVVDNTFVQLGGPGGSAVVVDNGALAASFAALQAALAGKGISWSPPTGYTATKAKAT